MKNHTLLLFSGIALLMTACQATPANRPTSTNPSASVSASPGATASPKPAASASNDVPEQLTDAIRLVLCAHARTPDPEKKLNYRINLNEMKGYTQQFWMNLNKDDPDGVNSETFAEARSLGCS